MACGLIWIKVGVVGDECWELETISITRCVWELESYRDIDESVVLAWMLNSDGIGDVWMKFVLGDEWKRDRDE